MSADSGGPAFGDKVVAIHRALSSAKVPHGIGGALALAYYAEPRTTVDVDVNVFVRTDDWLMVRDALESIGVDVEADEAALRRDGQVRLWWGRNPVDLFFSYDPFHDEMEKAVRRVPYGEDRIPILGPEHLTVCKAMFDRPKDWLDIEAILVVTQPFDAAEVRSWLVRMVGGEDARVAKLDGLLVSLDLRPGR